MSDEWQVMEIEWWVMSDKKKNSKQALNNSFLVFKQHYTLFYTLFHPHVFQKTTNNITQTQGRNQGGGGARGGKCPPGSSENVF